MAPAKILEKSLNRLLSDLSVRIKTISGDCLFVFICFLYVFGFLVGIEGSGVDRTVREGVMLISFDFHQNPTTGGPKTAKKVIPVDMF